MIKKLLRFIALVVVLESCQMDRQALIVGRWNLIDVISDSVSQQDTWSFDNTGDCFIIRDKDGVQDTLSEGQYLIKNQVLTIAGETIIPYFMGDWSINSIDEDHMTLVFQGSGLEYFEFTKED